MHRVRSQSLILLLSTLILIFEGCVAAPAREDPLAGLSFSDVHKADPLEGQSLSNIPKADLTVGMVISQNSKNAVEYMAQVRDQWNSLGSPPDTGLDAVPLVDGLTNILESSFSQVVRVDNPSNTSNAGADLLAVVDLYLTIGQKSFETTEVDLKVIFTRLDGHPIQSVRGTGKKKLPFPMWDHQFLEASNKALASFKQSFAHLVSK